MEEPILASWRVCATISPVRGQPESCGLKKGDLDQDLFLHELPVLNDPAARVLDLGSGLGTFDYRRWQATVVSVDNDPQVGSSRSADAGAFVLADAAALPFGDRVFKLAVANFVLEHFHRPAAALAEIQRVLLPAGLLYLAVPNCTSLEDRLFRLAGGGKYHVRTYCFHSLLKLVYRYSTLKLLSFADWPAGYLWLNSEASRNPIRRLLFHILRCVSPWLRAHSRPDSGFVLLFRKEEQAGFRLVTHICSHCGAGATIFVQEATAWACQQCGGENPLHRVRSRP